MNGQVIVLNGGSSAGKSSLARQLQNVLPGVWLTLGVDTFIEALPPALQSSDAGVNFGPDGQVTTGETFRRLDMAWSRGVGEMARHGANVIVDEVFLGGADSQARWLSALEGLNVLWVGVKCDAAVAERRELERVDRVVGMARLQAELVHQGVRYDLEVDTTHTSTSACARQIAALVLG
ncbi:chloramphenicol phosphotransferase [Deinococcus rubellus]|uniref:Chloramphenicol phosphotransferase CPT n=1 Tax=Deinococcus rubellus TaxID=1889240 RepID=A0ABY5YCT3_9DEIO|nr:chloramphenicol phosphotransferase CPT [Deinococcus rubellus]UWX62867.1 chloramphenicol phosphotransferase CPT [Deinococcus rubellus]